MNLGCLWLWVGHMETCTNQLCALYFSFIRICFIFHVPQTDKWVENRLLAITCMSCLLPLSPWQWLKAEEAGVAYKFPLSLNKYLYYLADSPSFVQLAGTVSLSLSLSLAR